MKTNQIMIREGLVEQRTSDYYFNATITSENWFKTSGEVKKPSEFLRTKQTKEFLKYLEEVEGIEKPYTSSNKGTWMHPLLYVDFCMWISVEFKTMALKYVLDGLINTRHSAGDYYKEMYAAVMETYLEVHNRKPEPLAYIKEANMIKDITGLNKPRNEMTETELSKITILQKVNSTLIRERVGLESRKRQLITISKSI